MFVVDVVVHQGDVTALRAINLVRVMHQITHQAREPHRASQHDAFIVHTRAPGHADKQEQVRSQENGYQLYQELKGKDVVARCVRNFGCRFRAMQR